MERKLIVFAVILLLSGVTYAAQREVVDAVILTERPTIDGNIDMQLWGEEHWHDDFRDLRLLEPAREQTRFKIGHDATHLFAVVRCNRAGMDEVPPADTHHGGAVWDDESVELFFRPSTTSTRYFQIIVNSWGAIYKGSHAEAGAPGDTTWSPDLAVATRIDSEGWTLELALPFADIDVTDGRQDPIWLFNIGRNSSQNSSFARLRGAYHQPYEFTPLCLWNNPCWKVEKVENSDRIDSHDRILYKASYTYTNMTDRNHSVELVASIIDTDNRISSTNYTAEIGANQQHQFDVALPVSIGGMHRIILQLNERLDTGKSRLLRTDPFTENFQQIQGVRKIDGYRGIWFDLGQRSAYGSKYSGGLGTYTAKHIPLAFYADAVEKTFFVYGGTTQAGERRLLAMVSYYDHREHVLPKPTVVHEKVGVTDPHDNPSISIDSEGHIWVFVSGRGRGRPGLTYRSLRPYDIEGFELIFEDEFTYPQPWWIEGSGFLHLFTRYSRGRELYWNCSPDGREWTDARRLAGMGGHYQVSNEKNGRVVTAFNMHPGGNVDRRTNLYFVQTFDRGQTWRLADGTPVETPLTDPKCASLIHDYRSDGRLVYVKDIGFDLDDNPVILYLTSAHHQPGPGGEPRAWMIARWTGEKWLLGEVAPASHNYDMGSLYLEDDGTWRIIAPTERGPQEHGTGGEIAMWISQDNGQTWRKVRQPTADSERNQKYARRPVNAHPDFYAFWADGNPDSMSISKLYFTNKTGENVWQLPYDMEEDVTAPIQMHKHNP